MMLINNQAILCLTALLLPCTAIADTIPTNPGSDMGVRNVPLATTVNNIGNVDVTFKPDATSCHGKIGQPYAGACTVGNIYINSNTAMTGFKITTQNNYKMVNGTTGESIPAHISQGNFFGNPNPNLTLSLSNQSPYYTFPIQTNQWFGSYLMESGGIILSTGYWSDVLNIVVYQ